MTPLLGKWLYPKNEQVAMQLISGGRVTYDMFLSIRLEVILMITAEPLCEWQSV